MDIVEKREMAVKVAWGFLGTPYMWGGDDPMAGFDCSGFCIEILKSVGMLRRKGDWTAQMLWDKFKGNEVPKPYTGCLVFWNNRTKERIVHVEFALNDGLCIGASGGGRKTITVQDAMAQNAYIKVRPWKTRSYVKGHADPFR